MRTVFTLLLVFLGACSADIQPALVASDITITRSMPGMTMRAGYLTLTNNSEETITITRVTSPNFASVMLHETVIEDGIARMRPLEKIQMQAGTSAILEPGGKHLMLMRPRDAADNNSTESVSLQFYDGPTLLLTVTNSEPR
jgi:copper(I)-binding protein